MAARLMLKSLLFESPPAEDSARLSGEVKRIGELGEGERAEMLALMSRYFEGIAREPFERDLGEKEWAILLRDQSGAIRGFSTLMRLEAEVEGQEVVAFFSGDTIIEREFWGESLLPRLWAHLAFGLAEQVRQSRPQARIYWFLIASGYKTYRFLPVFFRCFWPRFDAETPPFEARVLQVLGAQKFGEQWDRERQIVRLENASPLRPGVAEISGERLHDPHIAHFARLNPGHARGDELACLCPIEESNLSRAGRRMLGVAGG